MKRKMRSAGVPVMAAVMAALLIAAQAAAAAPPSTEGPSYAIPDIAAIVMCLAALAVPCMRYRRS